MSKYMKTMLIVLLLVVFGKVGSFVTGYIDNGFIKFIVGLLFVAPFWMYISRLAQKIDHSQ